MVSISKTTEVSISESLGVSSLRSLTQKCSDMQCSAFGLRAELAFCARDLKLETPRDSEIPSTLTRWIHKPSIDNCLQNCQPIEWIILPLTRILYSVGGGKHRREEWKTKKRFFFLQFSKPFLLGYLWHSLWAPSKCRCSLKLGGVFKPYHYC